jgi:hypothetical protein
MRTPEFEAPLGHSTAKQGDAHQDETSSGCVCAEVKRATLAVHKLQVCLLAASQLGTPSVLPLGPLALACTEQVSQLPPRQYVHHSCDIHFMVFGAIPAV